MRRRFGSRRVGVADRQRHGLLLIQSRSTNAAPDRRDRYPVRVHGSGASDAPAVQESEFDQIVGGQTLRAEFDADVAARLVAALVAGDGTVTDAERSSYAALFTGRSLDTELERRAPGRVDLEETTAGATRETILLLAWAVALTDERLAASEQATLDEAAAGLEIAPERAAELATIARGHVVDEAIVHLSASGLDEDEARQQVEQLGEQIGLGADEAARTLIRWRKRQG